MSFEISEFKQSAGSQIIGNATLTDNRGNDLDIACEWSSEDGWSLGVFIQGYHCQTGKFHSVDCVIEALEYVIEEECDGNDQLTAFLGREAAAIIFKAINDYYQSSFPKRSASEDYYGH